MAEYKGVLEVVPEAAQDVVILVAAPPPEEAVVSSLGLQDVGRVVLLQGVVTQEEAFSKGIRYTLDDNSGEMVLLLWSNVVDC